MDNNLIQKHERLVAFWCCNLDQKADNQLMNFIQKKVMTLRCDRVVIIVNEMTSRVSKDDKSFTFNPEIIALDDIQVNITMHHLVP